MNDDRVLWRIESPTGVIECQMISCCNGAELQVAEGGDIVLRELYPDKSTLYERARELRNDYEAGDSRRARF